MKSPTQRPCYWAVSLLRNPPIVDPQTRFIRRFTVAVVVSSTTQSLGAAIGSLIESASENGRQFVIRIEGGKAFQPGGSVTIGPDYLQFISEDQQGTSVESIVPLRGILEVARNARL